MSSAPNVPAWKRLGLKLKQPASGAEIGGPAPAEGSKPNGQQHHDRDASGPVVNAAYASPAAAAAAKRKRLDQPIPPPAYNSSPFKRTRTDGDSNATPTLRKQKSVTFADDVKNTATDLKKKKKSSKPAKPATQQPTADIKPSLEYLKTWKFSRQTWKFNKNYQTILMKRVFHPDAIPSSDIGTFYEYIQDLKGFTRSRLLETAAEVKKEDTEKGKAAFPVGTPDMDSKQSEYEKVLAGLMQLGNSSGSKRKRFDEAGFVSESTDVAITQRVIKRMRAETILEEMSNSEDSDAMTIDTEETAPPAQAAAAAPQEESLDKRVKLNDGTTKEKPTRRRKRRTNVDDSSSEESSDSDSSDSDSDSDSDEESDNASEVQRQAAQREAETSSESSSSSEEQDDSSEDESEEEEEVPKKRTGSKK
ncbi:hypothetical protein CORC01_06780 [Colletotrichum orchidophilum]|uniref:WKF domain-containing protein n=1 Tax=Colletotrichum orchidophilum TaxID=1209926 RepID=A0A1G4B905_9PEZI|nr:uncharacterized protein CORC01_06780 [Colletotrichum orchidophilum]OHE97917.1 hypothetical protein CORC01_06780 [Colletotrichum orchidophilum]